MQLQADAPVMFLENGEVVALDDAVGTRIGSRTGVVWVTQEGRLQDDVVSPGDSIVVANAGRTLVQALRPGWITLIAQDAVNDAH